MKPHACLTTSRLPPQQSAFTHFFLLLLHLHVHFTHLSRFTFDVHDMTTHVSYFSSNYLAFISYCHLGNAFV